MPLSGIDVECCVVAFHDNTKCGIGCAPVQDTSGLAQSGPFLGAADVQTVDNVRTGTG
ncbi:Sec-independent protein translocase protein tatA/E homolog [Mesorhizobium ventifaucium]|uniref:Sec-independent protein translocase protein tatA/E homolog n=2 Tax=Mesorhizobium TaxID=68287 RepID=A0A2P9AQN0_9HYPH|nr:Sec-independent protein translocase protein tatA/E homolog [Mesorhizobium ventifaucium]SJM33461.1 Sec-independent protein translocase protein tatA/E homolog [Mesorhizobium delmotii]